jgi:hypothetical protein
MGVGIEGLQCDWDLGEFELQVKLVDHMVHPFGDRC